MVEIICMYVFIYTQRFYTLLWKCDQRLAAMTIIHLKFAWNWTCQQVRPSPVLWKAWCFHTSLDMWSSHYTAYPDVPTRHWERKCNSHAVMMRKRGCNGALVWQLIYCVTFYNLVLSGATSFISLHTHTHTHTHTWNHSLDVGKDLMRKARFVFLWLTVKQSRNIDNGAECSLQGQNVFTWFQSEGL